MGEVLSLTGILHLVFHSFMRIESFPIINGKGQHEICASVTTHFPPLSSLFRICPRFTVSVSLPYHQSTKRQITYLRKDHHVKHSFVYKNWAGQDWLQVIIFWKKNYGLTSDNHKYIIITRNLTNWKHKFYAIKGYYKK